LQWPDGGRSADEPAIVAWPEEVPVPTPRALVVCYSRTGTTRQVADALAAALHCPLEVLVDRRRRTGGLRVLKCVFDAHFKRSTTLEPLAHDPADYELVVVATPVWANSLPPATRTFLATSKPRIKRAAFVCTEGQSGAGIVFKQMTAVCGRAPVAVLALRHDEVLAGHASADINDFLAQIGRSRIAA
jgi:flavodoxin